MEMKDLRNVLYKLKAGALSHISFRILATCFILVVSFFTLMIVGICSDSQVVRAQDWLESGFFDPNAGLEYHFDDGEDSKNPIRDSSGFRHEAHLMNGAHRTLITEGILYGRALELDGIDDYVIVDNREHFQRQLLANGFAFRLWLFPTDISGVRAIISKEGIFSVALCSGHPCITVQLANGKTASRTSYLYFPSYERNHFDVTFNNFNLVFRKNGGAGGTETLNISPTGVFTPINSLPIVIGSYAGKQDFFVGKIDDFWWNRNPYAYLDPREGNPSACKTGYKCSTEQIYVKPDEWDRLVPVRVSTVINSNLCDTPKKCRLLIMIAGGGRCSDGFFPHSKMREFADEGYMVSSIHPYCEHNETYKFYPQESSLIVKSIEYLLTSSIFTDRIDKSLGYYAVGGSHGAINVAMLVFKEDILPPERAWAISAIYDGHDVYHNCPEMTQIFLDHIDRWVGSLYGPHTETPEFLTLLNDNSAIDFDDPIDLDRFNNIVSEREFAASWGVNLYGGSCYEEEHGFTYSSRKLRDLWIGTNPQTGYFLENNSSNCQHGFLLPVDFAQGWTCIKQFFRCGPQCMPAFWWDCQ
jgi:hypothetical protein